MTVSPGPSAARPPDSSPTPSTAQRAGAPEKAPRSADGAAGDGAVVRPRRRTTLAMRTAAGVVALLAVVLSVFALMSLALTNLTVEAQLEQNVRQAWDRTYTLLWSGFRNEMPEPDFERDLLNTFGQPKGMLLHVTGRGEVFHASRLDGDWDPVELSAGDVQVLTALVDETLRDQASHEAGLAELPEEEREGVLDPEQILTVDLEAGQFLVHSEVIDDVDGVAVVGLPTTDVNRTKDVLRQVQVLGSLAALMAAGLLGWWWIRRSLRSLGEVSEAAARVADVPMGSGEVSLARYRVRRVLAEPGTEVGDVGFALNRLIGSVDGAFEQRNRSEQRLRTFVADASHELRTPLAAVRGYAEMIRLTEPLTDRGQDALSRVLQQSDRMGSLVEDLLLLARLDASRESRRGEVDLGEVVVDAVTDATAAGRDHDWTVDVPEDPVIMLGDRQQLAQLVANLLSNARKHTPPGTSVLVRLEKDDGAGPAAAPAGTVRLTVRDDGPGIDPELIPGLFDRFVRGDTARTAQEGSTGLGLSIVRSVARAHGGEATVESAPGRTMFTVEFPVSGSRSGAG